MRALDQPLADLSDLLLLDNPLHPSMEFLRCRFVEFSGGHSAHGIDLRLSVS